MTYLMKRFFNLSGPAALAQLVKSLFRHREECEKYGTVAIDCTSALAAEREKVIGLVRTCLCVFGLWVDDALVDMPTG